jgi:hypothetical protein
VTRAPHDPLGIIAGRARQQVLFGAVDVTNAIRGGRIHGSLDSRGELKLTLDADALPADPVDYLAPLEYRSPSGGNRFTGHVAKSVPDGRRIAFEAYGATRLVEQAVGTFVALDTPHQEIVYVMARAASMTDEQLYIQGLDALKPEIFEVLAPVHGVSVDDTARIGSVTLIATEPMRKRIAELGFAEHLDEIDADAFALGLATAALGYHAERTALAQIDLALSWIATRLRHAITFLPDGALQGFDRAERRAVPRRGDLVIVRGLGTGRRWLRSTTAEATAATARIDADDPLLHALPQTLRPVERLALSACRRAVAESEPLARIQAISEAIECLVSGVKVPRLWPEGDLRRLRDALPDDVGPELRQRARKAISDLNDPPLMPRLRHLIDTYGLPVSDAEIELLKTVRGIRNDAVHGREATPPAPEVLDYASAVLCRLTVEHLATL